MDALRILLVEDSEDDADLILAELLDLGMAIDSRRVDTEAAMRKALAESRWDLVISDFNLPRFSAAAALSVLQAAGQDLPFIIVSGFIGEETAVEMMKAGAHDFVMKNKLARLAAAIARELREAELRGAHRLAQQELLDSRERLQDLTTHLQTVREEERTRIARELHDELGQMLTALKMDVVWLKSRTPESEAGLMNKTSAMAALIDATLDAVRSIAADLRPVMLDDLGVRAAVEWLLEDFSKRYGINYALEMSLDDYPLDDPRATAAFRVVQECLTNVARHAQAGHVVVVMSHRDGELSVSVRDDGKGLEPSGDRRRNRYGLMGIRERAAHFGGSMKIVSAPNEGTLIEVRLPQTSVRETGQ
ncbi:oxygen sensor histidine kinase NreB [mine drainage metagenome]|uniref:Oxygen sensor histidine kinase NreB n=1 Tax=mine drainage metagenome TaxID=410659 RepID=A0A1J5RWN9_9ZZZZ